jgi:hypothetical protein
LRERYEDNPSTHPDFDSNLWMETRSSDGPDRNRVYGLSNTTAENLRATRSVSTIRSSQSVSSIQSQEFVTLQQHTSHLTEKYEQLSADYEQLRQMIMNMRSQMGSTYTPCFWSYNLLFLLLQRRHYSSLIFICTNKIVMNIWILYYSILFLHIFILYNLICLIIFFFCYSIQFYF